MLLPASPAFAQVNKGVFSYSSFSDTGYLTLRGAADFDIAFLGRIAADGDNADRGKLLLFSKTSNNASFQARALLSTPQGRGLLQLNDFSNRVRVDLRSSLGYGSLGTSTYGLLTLNGGGSAGENVYLGAGTTAYPDHGWLSLRRDGSLRARLRVQPNWSGELQLWNGNGFSEVIRLAADGGARGLLVRSLLGQPKAALQVVGPIGDECAQLALLGNAGDSIFFDTCDSGGGPGGKVMAHAANADMEIFYAGLHGPEDGLYVRGTATLSNGRAFIPLPEHFAMVASPDGLTAQLTPRSADSAGLAVVGLTPDGVDVAELNRGMGAYAFDYVIYGQRLGREDFAAVRPSLVRQLNIPDGDAATEPAADELRTPVDESTPIEEPDRSPPRR